MMKTVAVVAMVTTAFFSSIMSPAIAVQCGKNANGALCANCLCCSSFGWCGSTADYCGTGCQSQCDGTCSPPPGPPPPPPTPTPPPPPAGDGVGSIVTEALFERMLKHRNDAACPARGFYTYGAFIEAAAAFPGFGTTGSGELRTRELAAFLGQTGHETTGGWPTAPDGAFTWGYCFNKEIGADIAGAPDYCDDQQSSNQWPCAAGKKYFGRGPIQLSWNYNYGPAGEAPEIGEDLLGRPEMVAEDAVVSFKTAIWFWMTPQPPKPSCHDVITGQWNPTDADVDAGRVPGYGVITNIINGGLECGHGFDDRAANRTFFYTSYCDILGVGYGDNLDCYNQQPFGYGTTLRGADDGTATAATLEYHADA